MEVQSVFILFSCNQWFSKDSMRIIGDAVYLNIEHLLDMAYADYYAGISDENYVAMTKEDFEEDKEIFKSRLRRDKQISYKDYNCIIEKLELK